MSKVQILKCATAAILCMLCMVYVVANVYYAYGKNVRDTIINVKYGDNKTELFGLLENVGLNLTPSQREEVTEKIRSKTVRSLGFKAGGE